MNKEKELIPGQKYYIEKTSSFCHIVDKDGFRFNQKEGMYIFIGKINLPNIEDRYIFYESAFRNSKYLMYSRGVVSNCISEENYLKYQKESKKQALNKELIENLDSLDSVQKVFLNESLKQIKAMKPKKKD